MRGNHCGQGSLGETLARGLTLRMASAVLGFVIRRVERRSAQLQEKVTVGWEGRGPDNIHGLLYGSRTCVPETRLMNDTSSCRTPTRSTFSVGFFIYSSSVLQGGWYYLHFADEEMRL